MNAFIWTIFAIAAFGALAYFGINRYGWIGVAAAFLFILDRWSGIGSIASSTLWIVFLAVSVIMGIPALRRSLLSGRLLMWFRTALPQVSPTEQEALDAGTVWWDGELFSGNPSWQRLLATPQPQLSEQEQAFLDGPVEELCRLCDDWEITHELNDLPEEVWRFIKENGFVGMIIPKAFGGLGFSAYAHSQVVQKLATRNATACVSVMVPNSLGPAELLLHYGTDAQKNYYLPRLAAGQEMPCFALTSPDAGSDAGGIPDYGIVCMGMHEGQEVLGMRVTWEKRYITLSPVATLLGLAFKLYDPDGLLGEERDIGITLALIPTTHPGVNIGRRHFPLNAAFMNGPNSGDDVFIPLDWVIGGRSYVGQGWRMLMESLAAGRSISLPSSSAGMAKLAARTTGAYARVRSQFRLPIGKFEGVQEAMGRIGGNTYVIDAARRMTAGAIDLGEKPSVISAIMKYHATERGRQVVNDAMDVHGGKGICLGPSNYLGRAYQQIPIGITVEGANILTRTMMIFGQGAIRCHPYVLKEIAAAGEPDPARASQMFDQAFWGHAGFVLSNFVRALFNGVTGAKLVGAPGASELKSYYQQLTRMSAAFALSADVAMLVLGGKLKRKEKLSGRLGDILSQLYLASAVLKRFEDDGRPKADLPLVHWALQDALYRIQEAFYGVFDNFPNRVAAVTLRLVAFPFGRVYAPPADALAGSIARLMMAPGEARERLGNNTFVWRREDDPVGCLELALDAVAAGEAAEARLRTWVEAGTVDAYTEQEQLERALDEGALDEAEGQALRRFRELRRRCIMVDDFEHDIGRNKRQTESELVALAALDGSNSG
jgi:acyl-CoA dehydrogenase